MTTRSYFHTPCNLFSASIESLLVAGCSRINLAGKTDDLTVSTPFLRHELTYCLGPTFRVSFGEPATEEKHFFFFFFKLEYTNRPN